MNKDRLTAKERQKLNKLKNRMARWSLYGWAAAFALLAAAVWVGDWRFAGLALLAIVAASVLAGLNAWMSNPANVQRLATSKRDKDRDQAADIEDLERDLGL